MRRPIDTQTVQFAADMPDVVGCVDLSEYGRARESLLLTVEEAAKSLRIGRTSAYELVMRGTIQSVKIGRRRLAVRAGLEAFVESLSQDQSTSGVFRVLHSTAPRASAACLRSGSSRCP